GMKLDLVVVQDHRPAAGDDVIELVGLGVIVELGVVYLDMMDFGGGLILLFHKATDVAARLPPGLDVGRIAAEIFGGGDGSHGPLREEIGKMMGGKIIRPKRRKREVAFYSSFPLLLFCHPSFCLFSA